MNKIKRLMIFIIFLSFSIQSPLLSQISICKWYGNRDAAFSMNFDDSAESQLYNAIPILNKYNLKGTFCICTGYNKYTGKTALWRQAFLDGHELSSHTVTHPWHIKGTGVKGDPDIEDYTPDMIRNEVLLAKKAILELIPEYKELTFQYPAGSDYIGTNKNDNFYRNLVKENYMVSLNKNMIDFLPELNEKDLIMKGWSSKGGQFDDLKNLIDRTIDKSGWARIGFHGIGGQHLRVELDVFVNMCKYLYDNNQKIWTATNRDAFAYLKERLNTKINIIENSDKQIRFRLANNLNMDFYTIPLTLEVRVPPTWLLAKVEQGNKTEYARVEMSSRGKVIYVNATPNEGIVSINKINF